MRTLGRAAEATQLDEVGDLSEADLSALDLPRSTSEVPALQKLRDSHHNIARLLASGLRPGQAALAAGYSQARVSVLLADPTFQNLIAEYRRAFTEKAVDAYGGYLEDATAVLSMSTRMIRDQLEEADEIGKPVPMAALRDNVVEFGDRLGFAKKSVNLNVNVDLGDRLAAARQRAFAERPMLPASTPNRALEQVEGERPAPNTAPPSIPKSPALADDTGIQNSQASSQAAKGTE